MARVRVRSARGHYWIAISGRLTSRDLRRLERACGPALEKPVLPVTIRLADLQTIDAPAQAFLSRLAHRGAVLLFE